MSYQAPILSTLSTRARLPPYYSYRQANLVESHTVVAETSRQNLQSAELIEVILSTWVLAQSKKVLAVRASENVSYQIAQLFLIIRTINQATASTKLSTSLTPYAPGCCIARICRLTSSVRD